MITINYKTRHLLIKSLIFIELVIILSLVLVILNKFSNKNRSVLGDVTFIPFESENYVASNSSNLKYYYEPTPNSRIVDFQPIWQPKKYAYTINLDTLNERYDYNLEKQKGVYRIITLGDSYTFGLFINTPDNWTELLEDKLNNLICKNLEKFEVINLGLGGYGPEYIKERYEIRGKKYNPDLIIWNESGKGFDRVNEIFMPIVRDYELKMSEEELHSSLESSKYIPWIEAYKYMYNNYSYVELSDFVSQSWKDFYEIRESVPVLVASYEYITNSQKKLLIDWAKGNHNVYFYFDLPGSFSKKQLFPDSHPNEIGHKAIAESTLDYLKQNILQECY